MKNVRNIIAITSIIIIACLSIDKPVFAAEIECSDTYNNGDKINSSSNPHWKDFYPSGRLPSNSTCMIALINGDIVAGDSEKFSKILNDNSPFLTSVYLASSGGSVEEAIKIGELVRKYMLATFVPTSFRFSPDDNGHTGGWLLTKDGVCPSPNCHCASSCFLIWAAGAERFGNMIGIHRPSIHSSTFANLSPDKSSAIYKQELIEINKYLTDMEVPQKYIDTMTDVSSSNIYWLKYNEAESMQGMPPSIEESMSASCGQILTKEETRRLRTISGLLQLGKYVSEDDKAFAKSMGKIEGKTNGCIMKKLARYRDSIN